MNKFEKYSSYKDSGVEWLGEIPEHWEIDKLKNYCKAFGRIGFRGYNTSDLVNESEGAITISPSNIFEYSKIFTHKRHSLIQIVPKGRILLVFKSAANPLYSFVLCVSSNMITPWN